MRRIVVVCNPRSSRYSKVRREVLDAIMNPRELRDRFGLSGITIFKYEVQPTNVDDNAKLFAKLIDDEDLVLAVGGDATAVIGLNGILLSEKDATLAVLPYGNFNDLARTLKMKKLEDVFSSNVKKLYPLEIVIDGKHFRYASCYATIGMMAEAVEIFDQKKIRKGLQKKKNKAVRSYTELVKWYFAHRHKKVFLPDFRLNGEILKKKSDYIAVNGASLARVMKGKNHSFEPTIFRRKVSKLTSFVRLVGFMSRSILCRVPGEVVTVEDQLEFLTPATVEIQSEGEYKIFEQISKIEIIKSKKYIKVVSGK